MLKSTGKISNIDMCINYVIKLMHFFLVCFLIVYLFAIHV